MNPTLNESLLLYCKAFRSLNRNRSLGTYAPHKVVLLLALLDLFEEDVYTRNCIAPSQKLQDCFERIWKSCIISRHHCNMAYPFYHLRQDGFWQLVPDNQADNSSPTLGQLRDKGIHAQLNTDLFMICQTSDGRLKLRNVLNKILEEDGQKTYLPVCPFCSRDSIGDVLAENSLALAFYDRFPVSQGHTLIIPKRHVASFFDLEPEEHNQIRELGKQCRDIVQQQFHPDGFNIGVNVGKSAGQSVFHCHIHLIPRYLGDVANPRGGVRGVIPAKQNY